MYSYIHDPETGGLLLTSSPTKLSLESRPVYAPELDMLKLNQCWKYLPQTDAPYMWAESNTYIYRGVKVAVLHGGGTTEEILTPVYILEYEPDIVSYLPLRIWRLPNSTRSALQHLCLRLTSSPKAFRTFRPSFLRTVGTKFIFKLHIVVGISLNSSYSTKRIVSHLT